MEEMPSKKQLKNSVAGKLLASGPGSIVVINADSSEIYYCNTQFETNFGVIEYDDPVLFTSLLEPNQWERLEAQMSLVTHDVSARNKYVLYRMKDSGGAAQSYYAYVSPVEELSEQGGNYFQLLLLPDLSKWSLPFVSFDTRELFLEQFDTIGFGSFEWTIPDAKVTWSQGVYNIYELKKEAEHIDYETIAAHTHPDDQKRAAAATRHLSEAGAELKLEMRIITPNKKVKTVDVIARTLVNEKGEPVKVVGSIRDITEQRTIEQDLKRNLKELNRSNKELEEFAYIASHDLQEPLRKISTFSDRLAEKYSDVLSGEGAMYLKRMMASAENMRLLIDNLLEFSRISKSTQPFAKISMDFVLREVLTELELVIEETGTVIKSDKLPELEVVHSQMKQLLSNILNNAIKFRKKDVKPIITINHSVLDDSDKTQYHLPLAGEYSKISICDNGIGFEEEYAERIFQIFQRLHGKSEYPGSGIGLAICKKIVDNHKGIIFAENMPEQGACFTIILPVKYAD